MKLKRVFPGILIFGCALLVRLACLQNFREIPFFSHLIVDSKAYDDWGWRIAQGQWFPSHAFYQAPLYPYFVGVFYAIFGHHPVWLRVLQAVLGSSACVVLGRATQKFFGRRAGLVAGWMLALYAPAVFFDCLIQKSVLDVFLLSVALLLLAHALDSKRAIPPLALGAALGLLTLSRENALALIPLCGLWLASPAANPPTDRRWYWQRLGLVGAASALVLAPVYLHNFHWGARAGITTYNVGTSFYIGNSQQATGGYVPVRDERGTTELEENDARNVAETAIGHPLTPDQVSRYWFRRTLGEIYQQPLHWMQLLTRKLGLVVNAVEVIDTDDIYFYEQFSPVLRLLNSFWNFGLLLPLAVAGIVLNWQQRRRFMVLLVMAGVMSASLVLFYVVARYRHALVPFLVPLAAAGTVEISQIIARRRSGTISPAQAIRPLVPAALAFLVTFGLTRIPLTTRDAQLGTSYFNAAGAAWQDGHREAALQYFELAKQSGRTGPATELNFGALLAQMGKVDDALASFDRAQTAGADPLLLAQNRGTAYLAAGKFDLALRQYEQAEKLTSPTAELENSRGVALSKLQRPREAQKAFENAIQLRHDYTYGYIHLLEQPGTSSSSTSDLFKRAQEGGADMQLILKARQALPR